MPVILLLPSLLVSCMGSCSRSDPETPAQRLIRRHPDGPVVVAHRGASAYAPENTMAAFRRALELGADAVETDMHLTRDGRVALLHDATLERTTSGAGAVADLDLAAIQAADAGAWFSPGAAGERVPELGELLDLARGRPVALCLEIKGGAGIERPVRDALDERGMRGQAVIFSFDRDQIAAAKAGMPDVPALYLAPPDPADPDALRHDPRAIEDALALRADAIGLSRRRLDAGLVERAHAAGLPVFVYTVNDPAQAAKLAELGVDGLISDAPDQIAAALGGGAP